MARLKPFRVRGEPFHYLCDSSRHGEAGDAIRIAQPRAGDVLLYANIDADNTASGSRMKEELGFEVRLPMSRDEAIEAVTNALKAEGFGVLSRIDMDKAFREKIGEHFRPYTILGACNPQLAHAALTSAAQIGLMLPFNVTVEGDIEGSLLRIINPEILMQMEELAANDIVRGVADDARQRLQRVAEALRA